jgi:hypothetical protein
MVKYTRITATSLALATMTLAACSKSDKNSADSLKNDSALAANLALANKDTTPPKLADTATGGGMTKAATSTKPKSTGTTKKTATAPAPTKTTPAPATKPAAPAGPTSGMVAAGTTIALASNSKVCTNTNQVNDNFTAVTTEAISGSNGVAIPAGSTVNFTITELKRSENARDAVRVGVRVNSIVINGKTYPVEATVESADIEKIRDEPKSKDVQKVAVGAAAGAIAGRILGKSTKATVIGGAAGAAAGAATAAATANYQGCLNQGAKIVVKLDSPMTIAIGT